MKDKSEQKIKAKYKDVNTEQNAIYSDPKDAAICRAVPQPKILMKSNINFHPTI